MEVYSGLETMHRNKNSNVNINDHLILRVSSYVPITESIVESHESGMNGSDLNAITNMEKKLKYKAIFKDKV